MSEVCLLIHSHSWATSIHILRRASVLIIIKTQTLPNSPKIDTDQEHRSDVRRKTDPGDQGDWEELRQIFRVSHALESFNDYQEIRQSTNQKQNLPVYLESEKIIAILESNSTQHSIGSINSDTSIYARWSCSTKSTGEHRCHWRQWWILSYPLGRCWRELLRAPHWLRSQYI